MIKHDTPYFEFNEEVLGENIKQFKRLEKVGITILYALKANNYDPIVKKISSNGFGFDVASGNEIQLAMINGCNPNMISFSAPSKTIEDIVYAQKVGVKMFAADSEVEIEKIHKYSPNGNIFLRIGIEGSHAAFNLSEKFGMTEEYAQYIIRKSLKRNWRINGIAFHIGSQNTQSSAWKKALKQVTKLIKFAKGLGLEIKKVNLGGGIPAKYNSKVLSLDYYISNLINEISSFRKEFPKLEIYIEPGRAMVANTMKLYTKVIDIKPYKRPPLLILDTSVFGGVIEALEGFEYPILQKTYNNPQKRRAYRIGGYSCDGYDIIRERVFLFGEIKEGDIFIIDHAGAYTNVFEQFQLKPFPFIRNL